MSHCLIILPDLLSVPEEAAREVSLPTLERLLNCGKLSHKEEQCAEQTLMRHFGYRVPDATSIPAGKIRWAADFSEAAPEFCICADPVHMLADIDHARLMDASSLKLSNAESEHYIGNLNKVFAADGLEFVASSPDRWYLTGKDASMLKTLPVGALVGRNVASFLPEGDASAHWRTLTTEVQMLLFSDPMNQTREDQGQLSLNALWLWGGARYDPPKNDRPDVCYSNDVFCQGLANISQIPVHDLPVFSTDSLDGLLLMDSRGMQAVMYGDYAQWKAWVLRLETELFQPLWQALKSGHIENITFSVGGGRDFVVRKPGISAFWRRRKALLSFISEST